MSPIKLVKLEFQLNRFIKVIETILISCEDNCMFCHSSPGGRNTFGDLKAEHLIVLTWLSPASLMGTTTRGKFPLTQTKPWSANQPIMEACYWEAEFKPKTQKSEAHEYVTSPSQKKRSQTGSHRRGEGLYIYMCAIK